MLACKHCLSVPAGLGRVWPALWAGSGVPETLISSDSSVGAFTPPPFHLFEDTKQSPVRFLEEELSNDFEEDVSQG